MCKMQFLLVFVALSVRMAHSWDIATSAGDDSLSFYTNDSLTSTISIASRKIHALTYDEVHNMMLYVDKQPYYDDVCGYDLTTMENKRFTKMTNMKIHDLAFDPVTELVFFTDTNDNTINKISIKPGSSSNVILVIKVNDGIPRDIVVDSCEGYIYWLNSRPVKPTIERARLNGTEREVFETLATIRIDADNILEPNSLVIDQHNHRIYWMEPTKTTEYHLMTRLTNTKHTPFFTIIEYKPTPNKVPSNALTVSKDFIFHIFRSYSYVSSYSKVKSNDTYYSDKIKVKIDNKKVYTASKMPISIVANYKIKDQVQGCEALSQVKISTEYDGPYCVHGMKVNDQSACKCTPGYTGERCDVSVCDNYCLQGNCSSNTKGIPKCRCDAGYSGERCQFSICEQYCSQGNCSFNNEGLPECRCNAGYTGKRCDVSACDNYCSQGNCSFNNEGLPECRCNAGYTGKRCDVSACDNYCSQGNCSFNNEGLQECRCNAGYTGKRCDVSACDNYCSQGNCSFNNEGLPECRCNAGYTGKRCDVSACDNYCSQGNCSFNNEGLPECRCNAGYTGKRCDVSACDNYCSQGNCSFNSLALPECRCNAGYTGERCDVSVCENYCLRGNCSFIDNGLPKCRCDAGYSGKRCQFSICENFCMQGNCSLNDEGLPECRCNAGYTGERCEVNACLGYCLNNGECSLNEEDEPSCECVGGYEGTRCEAHLNDTLTVLVKHRGKSSTLSFPVNCGL